MTLGQWLGGWALLLASGYAWHFALAGPDGDWWVYVARYTVGFAGAPLLIAALLTFLGGWGDTVLGRSEGR